MPTLEEAATADRMYQNFEKIIHNCVTKDKYKPQPGDQKAAEECDKYRLNRFMIGGFLYGACVIPCTYIVNYPRDFRIKLLLTLPVAFFGGSAQASRSDQYCVLAVLNKNTPLAREMEQFLRRSHPDYAALKQMQDFSKIQDKAPSISWLKRNDPVRFKDFQYSEADLEEKKRQEENQEQGMIKPFGGMGGLVEKGLLEELKDRREAKKANNGEILDFWSQSSTSQQSSEEQSSIQ
eukprot:TRINITY_DN37544_c0_g1_i10.p3 TRINITY_DN37544_c0_g1~~TRINITY_DN37544_c0_g1_i10.p3  ORF type:complete len:236 (+),score=31.44 TRINITY_DN37544_c0_g1_i10:981-1688(+)